MIKQQQQQQQQQQQRQYKQSNLRVIPLGGLSEVGRNMTIFEYQGRS